VRFRQRQDPKEGKDGAWSTARPCASRSTTATARSSCFENARVNRDGDEVAGTTSWSTSLRFSSRPGRQGSSGGRVRAVIQPKINAADAEKK